MSKIKTKCEEDAARIAAEKTACEADLAKAQPYVDEAETAISSIKPAHIGASSSQPRPDCPLLDESCRLTLSLCCPPCLAGEIKKLASPADIIKLVFDGVLILFQKPLNPIRPLTLNVAKKVGRQPD